jgi:hypothetical protein
VADRVPPTDDQTNLNGSTVSYGSGDGVVNFTTSSYSKCTVNLPLDNYSLYLLSLFGVIGAYFIRKQLALKAQC